MVRVGLDAGHHFSRGWIWFQGPGRSPKSFKKFMHFGKLPTDDAEEGLEWEEPGSGRGVQARGRGIWPKAKGREGSHSETLRRE